MFLRYPNLTILESFTSRGPQMREHETKNAVY